MATRTIIDAKTGKIENVEIPQEEIEARITRLAPNEWKNLRKRRDTLLLESDNVLLYDRWNSFSELKKQDWLNYRQSLRDLPDNTTDPFNPIWPTKPE
jgi:hypothetical protein